MSTFQNISIREALQNIESGHYLLPAFQREFVWKHTQIEMLFDSLMRGYPINSMLFWKLPENADDKYKFYRFIKTFVENHKTKNEMHSTSLYRGDFAVLDGQQRLTALYIGLCGTYAYKKLYAWNIHNENNYPTRRLYLDISSIYTEDENDKMYHFEFLADKTGDVFEDKERKWFKVGKILSMRSIVDVRDFCDENNLSREEGAMLYKLFEVTKDDSIINYYEEHTHDPDIAVNVFSRINSGGTPLSYADILLAITISDWKQYDARNEIFGLVDSVNSMGFNITHDYILKAFLFLHHFDVQFRIRSFDKDFISGIEEKWPQIKEAILCLFSLLKYYGLNSATLTSNYATLPVLRYLYDKNIYKGIAGISHKEDRAIIKKWLFKTLLLKTFGYRSDGLLRKARHVLMENESNGFPADDLENALSQRITDKDFIDTIFSYQKESRYAYVLLSLLYQDLTFEGVIYHLDHIHPYFLCQRKGLDRKVFNSILNLQLLPESENTSKGAMGLQEWVDRNTTNKNRADFLRKQLIPDVDLSLDNFDEFIKERRELLSEMIKWIL